MCSCRGCGLSVCLLYFPGLFTLCYSTGEVFSYPDDFLAPDLALLFIMAILEVLRLYLGMSHYQRAFSGEYNLETLIILKRNVCQNMPV